MLRDNDSMSRVLTALLWSPVDKRIEYKPLLYMYKALHGLASVFLCELVGAYAPTENSKVSRIELTKGSTRETWEIWMYNFC